MSLDTDASPTNSTAPVRAWHRPPRVAPSAAAAVLGRVFGLAHAVVLVVGVFYGLSLRRDLIALAAEHGTRLTGWDVLLSFLSDPYFVVFLLAPAWLVSVCLRVQRRFDHAILVRWGSYQRWLQASTTSAAAPLTGLLLAWAAAGALCSAGLPWGQDWSTTSTLDAGVNQVLPILAGSGWSPAGILAYQTALMGSALLAGHVLLATVHRYASPHRFAMPLTAVAVTIMLTVSFKRGSELPDAIVLPNYLLAHQALASSTPKVLALLPALVLITGCYALMRWEHRWAGLGHRLGAAVPAASTAYAAMCVAGMLAVRSYADPWLAQSPSVWTTFKVAFYGASPQGASAPLYLYTCIVFLGYVYLFLLRLDQELGTRSYYVMLRRGSPTRWAMHIIVPPILGAAALLTALFATALAVELVTHPSAAISWATDNADSSAATAGGGLLSDATLPMLTYQYFVNGTLQLLVYLLLVFVVAWAGGRTLWALVALGAAMTAGLPALNVDNFLPSALNSLGYTELDWPGLSRITIQLVLSAAVLTITLALLLRQQRSVPLER